MRQYRCQKLILSPVASVRSMIRYRRKKQFFYILINNNERKLNSHLTFRLLIMSVEEKQARSVFVGNIPHGTTEDQMKEIFSVIGPVLSFRIVFDRETGNPKGYGFAEYAGKHW